MSWFRWLCGWVEGRVWVCGMPEEEEARESGNCVCVWAFVSFAFSNRVCFPPMLPIPRPMC